MGKSRMMNSTFYILMEKQTLISWKRSMERLMKNVEKKIFRDLRKAGNSRGTKLNQEWILKQQTILF